MVVKYQMDLATLFSTCVTSEVSAYGASLGNLPVEKETEKVRRERDVRKKERKLDRKKERKRERKQIEKERKRKRKQREIESKR